MRERERSGLRSGSNVASEVKLRRGYCFIVKEYTQQLCSHTESHTTAV